MSTWVEDWLRLGDKSEHEKRTAVLRTAPWVAMCYTLLVLWYMGLNLDLSRMGLPLRPWYGTNGESRV